jgi:hypothetical protein
MSPIVARLAYRNPNRDLVRPWGRVRRAAFCECARAARRSFREVSSSRKTAEGRAWGCELGSNLISRPFRFPPDYIVSGQTLLLPDRFEVDVLVVKATNGRVNWAETFKRMHHRSEIIALRKEVADRVARALGEQYGAIQSDRSRDADEQASETPSSYAAVRFSRPTGGPSTQRNSSRAGRSWACVAS